MTTPPPICIIGAGCSGFTTAKMLKERGIRYDCFEKSDTIGGNWTFRNKNGVSSAYRSLHIDTSKSLLAYNDFPMPSDFPDFPHHTHMAQYFNDYVDHFGLRETITFNTSVERAERLADGTPNGGGWQISLDNGDVRQYETLVVCNGHHWNARWPEPKFPGKFNGLEMHSHDYVDPFEPVDMRGKNVLVVGIGNSAVDIASELGRKGLANQLLLSTRNGAYIIPKYIFGKPVDQVVKTVPLVPLKWQRALASLLLRVVVGKVEDYGLPKPNHKVLEAHPTVSSELLLRLGSGDIIAKPNIAELQGDRVKFVDGSTAEIDVIIYATGYKISFPFFDEDFIAAPDNHFPLFKRIFKPGLDNLMFVGLAQPIPSLIKFVQLQAQWMADYLAGEYVLPSESQMRATIQRDEAIHNKHYLNSKRHTMQVDYYVYKWDLEKEMKRGRKRARRAST